METLIYLWQYVNSVGAYVVVKQQKPLSSLSHSDVMSGDLDSACGGLAPRQRPQKKGEGPYTNGGPYTNAVASQQVS